jgi:hypothetical protein
MCFTGDLPKPFHNGDERDSFYFHVYILSISILTKPIKIIQCNNRKQKIKVKTNFEQKI